MSESLMLYVTSHVTGELLGTRDATKDIKQPSRFVIPPYCVPQSHPQEQLQENEYWAYLNASNEPVRHYSDGKWIKKVRYVKVTAYNKQTREPKEFADKSLVTSECTLLKPKTPWDEWSVDSWVTNLSDKYIAEYNQVDDTRRYQYDLIVRPLMDEAQIKRVSGTIEHLSEADELEKQAIAARLKIQTENPWPTPPTE
ncbi:hypothetical protein [Vibrio sp. TRT 17S01]|uniref:hypothetical protein n=1 Tax=Vibrio sp. TRT 17S01 TaxID=3418505 RepID=UPI003CEF85BC